MDRNKFTDIVTNRTISLSDFPICIMGFSSFWLNIQSTSPSDPKKNSHDPNGNNVDDNGNRNLRHTSYVHLLNDKSHNLFKETKSNT